MNVKPGILIGLILILITNCSSQDISSKVHTRIGYIPITDHLILGITKEQDSTNYQQIDLDPIRFSDTGSVLEGVRSGSLEGGLVLAPLAFQAKLKGAPIKIVLLGHRDGSSLIVNVKKGINSVQDLKGKTIAIPHRFSTHNMLLHLYTSKAGLKYGEDFKTIEMLPPEMPAALAGGSIDGFIVAEPMGARAELLGVGKVLVLSNQIWEHHPDCVLVMREDYLNAHPEAMDELAASLIKAGIFAEENRDQATKIGSSFLGQPLDAVRKAMLEPKERVTFYDLYPRKEEFTQLQDYMADKMGLFPQKVNMDELVDTQYAESAYQKIGNESRALEYKKRE